MSFYIYILTDKKGITKMKKIKCGLLIMGLVFCVCGCGSKTPDSTIAPDDIPKMAENVTTETNATEQITTSTIPTEIVTEVPTEAPITAEINGLKDISVDKGTPLEDIRIRISENVSSTDGSNVTPDMGNIDINKAGKYEVVWLTNTGATATSWVEITEPATTAVTEAPTEKPKAEKKTDKPVEKKTEAPKENESCIGDDALVNDGTNSDGNNDVISDDDSCVGDDALVW
jgi:hypothetical protein